MDDGRQHFALVGRRLAVVGFLIPQPTHKIGYRVRAAKDRKHKGPRADRKHGAA